MKDFVPYNEALALKDLDFDEPCFGFYERDKELVIQECEITDFSFESLQCVAPTFSQAFRFFREKYGKESYVRKLHTYYYHINDTEAFVGNFSTYEEAELECLKKLIEICKSK